MSHKKIQDKINKKLVSFNLISLYTNITYELGIKSIKYCFDKYLELIYSRFNKSFIFEALKLVLRNKHFVFIEEFFDQVARASMGTIAVPTYVTLVVR